MNWRRVPLTEIAISIAAVVAFAGVIRLGWFNEPPLAGADYAGTIDVSPDDAKLYRAVPFEWRARGAAGLFSGDDAAHIRVDPTGERALVCGWLRIGKAGISTRASRWLAQARLHVGGLVMAATFIAPVEADPGRGLNAGCARLDEARPAADAPLSLEGPAVDD